MNVESKRLNRLLVVYSMILSASLMFSGSSAFAQNPPPPNEPEQNQNVLTDSQLDTTLQSQRQGNRGLPGEAPDREAPARENQIAANETPTSTGPGMFSGNRTASRRTFGQLAEQPGLHSGGSIYSLLQFKSVRMDLEMIDSQLDEFNDTVYEVAQARRERDREKSQLNTPSPGEEGGAVSDDQLQLIEFRERESALRIEEEQRVAAVLLPHQQERLEQIKFQLQVQSLGLFATLQQREIAAKLNVDETQLGDLKQSTAALAAEFELRVRELKKEFREKLQHQLTDEQQAMLLEMSGPEFKLHGNPEDDYN